MRIDIRRFVSAAAGEEHEVTAPRRRRGIPLALAAILLAFTASAAEISTENNASCDIGPYPAATLLLPYFEVDFNAPVTTAVNTLFTVTNTSRYPQVIRVTIWTDLGYPASWFEAFLTGYDAQTISLYEIIARGRYPMTTPNIEPGITSESNTSNPNMLVDMLCHPFGGGTGAQ